MADSIIIALITAGFPTLTTAITAVCQSRATKIRDGNNNYMTRTVPGDASSFVLDIVHPGANNTAYWYMSRWTVSGTSLTASATCGRKIITSTISSATSKDVYITKVVGVKY